MKADIAVIGGGPGGYVAAIRAASQGAKVMLAEKAQLGGVCLNRGCIPTKTLLKSAEQWRFLQQCSRFGLKAEATGFDYQAILARRDEVVSQMRKGIGQLLKSHAIEVVSGTARLTAANRLCIRSGDGEQDWTADRIILATGSTPAPLPVPGGDLAAVLNSDHLLALPAVPESLAVIGGGAVGIEFAAIFQAFGCRVSVIEMQPSILPTADSEMVRRLTPLLRKQGVSLITGSRVTAITPADGGVRVSLAGGGSDSSIVVEKVLAAAGRMPLLANLGLEAAGVAFSSRGICVNERQETSVAGIYAIGDVTGRYMWAHAASAAGIAAADNACGKPAAVDYQAVPGCVYTTPELAMTGLTEQAAAAQGKAVKISKFNLAANGKAVSMGEPEGLVKIIADQASGAVLGMHVLGAHASDLIMEGVLAIQHRLTAKDLAKAIHPHPSLAEAVMECAHGIDGGGIHQLRLH